jgi:flagellum-specific peptidoglycan hydrolase FlgJ
VTKLDFLSQMEEAWDKVKPEVNKAVLFAQAAHESNWGMSGLSLKANNLFGIKAGSKWTGPTLDLPTWEVIKGKRVNCIAKWRKYADYAECIKDYETLIKGLSWFRDALQTKDADSFLRNILPEGKEPGWATDPKYFSKVRAVGAEIEKLGGPRWC